MSRSVPTPLQAGKFSRDELVDRAFRRVAEVIHGWWEESSQFCPTEVLCNPLIPDEYILAGESSRGASYREHVVPRILLCNESLRMFKEDDATVEDVAKFLQKFLQIVRITSDEQYRLDVELKLKREMPAGWTFQNGSVYARLEEADIKWTPYEK